nr:MAG TPA: hypothetical protein [Caudoviricetes sp.]
MLLPGSKRKSGDGITPPRIFRAIPKNRYRHARQM